MTSSFPHRASKKRTRRHKKKKKSNPFASPRFQKATPDTSGTTNFPRRAGRRKRKNAKKANPFEYPGFRKANGEDGERFFGEDAADTSMPDLLIQSAAEQDTSATGGEAQRQEEREDSVMKEDEDTTDWANFGYETVDFDPLRDEDRVDWSVEPL